MIGDATALRDIEFRGPPRAGHPIGEVPGMDHANAAERARRHDLAHPPDRQIVAVRMPDLENHAGAHGRLDHGSRLLDTNRHRLLGQDVFVRSAGLRDVLGMQFGRRRDVNRIEPGMKQHRRQVGVDCHPGFHCRLAHLRGRLCDGHEVKIGIFTNCRQERPARGPHSGDTDANIAAHAGVASLCWSRLQHKSKLTLSH
jgi:hypothetical protein